MITIGAAIFLMMIATGVTVALFIINREDKHAHDQRPYFDALDDLREYEADPGQIFDGLTIRPQLKYDHDGRLIGYGDKTFITFTYRDTGRGNDEPM